MVTALIVIVHIVPHRTIFRAAVRVQGDSRPFSVADKAVYVVAPVKGCQSVLRSSMEARWENVPFTPCVVAGFDIRLLPPEDATSAQPPSPPLGVRKARDVSTHAGRIGVAHMLSVAARVDGLLAFCTSHR
jgi:hypothetical protein